MGFLDGIGGGDGGGGFDMSSLMNMFGGGQGGSGSSGGMGGLGNMMGGSGGGLGGMSGLMDPAGILSGGNPLDRVLGDLGKVENFLGINQKKPMSQADAAQMTNLAQQELGQQTGTNQVTQFGQTMGPVGQCEPAAQTATTECWQPPYTPSGYSSSPTTCGTLASQQSAATGGTPDWGNTDEGRALSTVASDFPQFENRGAFQSSDPNSIDWNSLQGALNDPNPNVASAASYLMSHPQLMQELIGLSANGQDGFSRQALAEYIGAQNGISSAPNASSPTTSSSGVTYGDGSMGNMSQMPALPYGVTQGTCTNGSAATSTTPNATGTNNMSYQQTQQAVNQLSSQGNLSKDQYLQLQNLMQQQQEMFTMMSNISKMLHDMAMTAINNMRG